MTSPPSPDPGAWLEAVRAHLELGGLNHVGVVSAERYDAALPGTVTSAAIAPGTRSIVVVASGGRTHWERFLGYLRDDPRERLAGEPHPLDRFTRHLFASLARDGLLAGCRVLHPHADAPVQLDFVRLGELAGLGRRSELGLLVSRRFGPWLGLRAAIFTPHALDDGAVEPVRLCDGCAAPCRRACPPRIVGPHPFPWRRCVVFRRIPLAPCRDRCSARAACVVAPEQRYDDLERLYHERRAAGRAALCALLGIRDLLP